MLAAFFYFVYRQVSFGLEARRRTINVKEAVKCIEEHRQQIISL